MPKICKCTLFVLLLMAPTTGLLADAGDAPDPLAVVQAWIDDALATVAELLDPAADMPEPSMADDEIGPGAEPFG